MIFLTLLILFLNPLAAKEQAKHRQNITIVALAPHIVELLFDIGADGQIIGTSSYADYPEAAKLLPIVGDHSRLQIEKIVQLKPDLIVAWKSGNPLDDLSRLEKYGLNVVYSDPKELIDIGREIQWLGRLTGHEDRANQLAATYFNKLEQLESRYKNRKAVSIFYEIWSNPLQTISANAWPQKHIELCGGKNIFSIDNNDYPNVSSEQVLTHKPQLIIQPLSNMASTNLLFNWSKYEFLPAIKNALVYHPDADKVHRMTTRVLDEIELMCVEIERARKLYRAQK